MTPALDRRDIRGRWNGGKMLSDELANVADWITGYTKDDTPIPAKVAASLASVLMDYAERAKQMEIAPVRPLSDVY